MENHPHATIHPGPNPIICVRSQFELDIAFRVDQDLVIIFKRAGADADETPSHSFIEGTSAADLPSGAETIVVVYGYDSSEGAGECNFHTGCARKNIQPKEVVLCTDRAELKEAKLPNAADTLLAFVYLPQVTSHLQFQP